MGKKSKAAEAPPLFDADEDKAEKEAASSGAQLPSSAMGKYFSHPDKKLRDKAVAVFSKWVSKQEHLEDEDHVRIWKALFYCFWMSDKVPVQRELADRLAGLINACASQSQTEKFIRAFYTTMQREWSGIDRLRLDKFYNLIRCFQRETFVYLAKSHWRAERITMANKIVSEGPLGLGRGGGVTPASKTPGLQLHMVDILLEEITEALHEGITVDGWMLLLEPYTQLLGSSVDRTVFERVVSRIFQELAGPKWLRAGLAEQGDDDDEIKTKKLRHANRMFRHTYVEPLPEHSISEHFQDTAFAAEVANAMTSKIFAMTISPDTWEFGRRKLYDLLAEYKQLCADLGQPFEDDPDAVELPKKRKKNAFLKKQRRDKRAKAAEEALEGDGDGFGAAGGESASADDADEAGGDSDDAQGHSRSREGAGDDEAEEEAAPVTARPVKAGKSASKARMVSAKEASPRKTRSGKTR